MPTEKTALLSNSFYSVMPPGSNSPSKNSPELSNQEILAGLELELKQVNLSPQLRKKMQKAHDKLVSVVEAEQRDNISKNVFGIF